MTNIWKQEGAKTTKLQINQQTETEKGENMLTDCPLYTPE